jgi:hypothetical protein
MSHEDLKAQNDRLHQARIEQLSESLTFDDLDELEYPLRLAFESRFISIQLDAVHALQLVAMARECLRMRAGEARATEAVEA